MERSLQSKNFDFDQILTVERTNKKQLEQELTHKIGELEKELDLKRQDSRKWEGKYGEIKSTLVKVEYEKKILGQEVEAMRTELAETRSLKEKNLELSRQAV